MPFRPLHLLPSTGWNIKPVSFRPHVLGVQEPGSAVDRVDGVYWTPVCKGIGIKVCTKKTPVCSLFRVYSICGVVNRSVPSVVNDPREQNDLFVSLTGASSVNVGKF